MKSKKLLITTVIVASFFTIVGFSMSSSKGENTVSTNPCDTVELTYSGVSVGAKLL